jgi:hypothetical protein
MGYRQTTLVRLARNDKLARFRSNGGPDRFLVAMKQQSSSTMRLRQVVSMILIWRTKGKEIRQNNNLAQNPTRKHNPDKEPSQEDLMVVMRL